MSKTWGTPTWYFFHCFSEKVNADFFLKNKSIILSFIQGICYNLPCPDCTVHAKQYLKSHQLNSISNKEDLKKYFFNFHDSVNNRLYKGKFKDYDMYKNGNINNIFSYFKDKYGQNSLLNRGFSDSFQRKIILKNLESFMQNNSTTIFK